MATLKGRKITPDICVLLLKNPKFLRACISKLEAAIQKDEEEISRKKRCLAAAEAQLRRLEENGK